MEIEQTTRREFLRHTAAAGGSLIAGSVYTAQAGPKNSLSPDRMGVLVDTTVCVGCRTCEWACKNAHGIPTQPYHAYEDRTVLARTRRPTHSALTVVNEFPAGETNTHPIDVKTQCMHCDHPACVSACIVGAFTKQEDGSVLWDGDKCIGCRYCMVACPFQIPSFEYSKAIQPDIAKCDFCAGRTSQGMLPACVDICPVGAMTYGPRTDLIKVARARMDRYPNRYLHHLYGEYEAGGTGWLYMASRDFSSLGFPDVGTRPMPGTAESIQHGIFAYFMPPVMLYALLGALMWITKKRREIEEEAGE
ncbi:MAG: 4Fe-4S dicluster domain-containing protein [Ignavibacteria bacterium]|nr:4Fe-4S dicluster domain-containing protein [Ignavibacteria bacterium]